MRTIKKSKLKVITLQGAIEKVQYLKKQTIVWQFG